MESEKSSEQTPKGSAGVNAEQMKETLIQAFQELKNIIMKDISDLESTKKYKQKQRANEALQQCSEILQFLRGADVGERAQRLNRLMNPQILADYFNKIPFRQRSWFFPVALAYSLIKSMGMTQRHYAVRIMCTEKGKLNYEAGIMWAKHTPYTD
jgi:hypothetical protein